MQKMFKKIQKIKMKKKTELGKVWAEDTNGGVLAFDLDDIIEEKAKKVVERVIEKERLGNAVLIESSKDHFHCYFFWDRLNWDRILEIINSIREIDQKFKDFKKSHGFLRMRFSNIQGIPMIINSKYHRDNGYGTFNYNLYVDSIRRHRSVTNG